MGVVFVVFGVADNVNEAKMQIKMAPTNTFGFFFMSVVVVVFGVGDCFITYCTVFSQMC